MKLIHRHYCLVRRSIDQPTGAWSITWAELLYTSCSGTLRWRLSPTSLHPTWESWGWTKCPARWALTVGNLAKCVIFISPIQTTLATIITHVSFTTYLLNALFTSCNSLCWGNICRMLQERISMMLKNISTQRCNQATGGGMTKYVSWISS